MTTVVYKDGIIAFDSRVTRGDIIINDNTNKIVKTDSAAFVFAGRMDQSEKLIRLYLGEDLDVDRHFDTSALVSDKGQIYYIGANCDDGFFKCEVTNGYSIGSGCPHAYTAMDMGATAKEAVKMATKRDIYSGGRVRSFKAHDIPS